MNNQKLLKIAGVLLLSVLMLIPASAAVANTHQKAATTISSIAEPNTIITTKPTQPMGRDLLYDNGPVDGLNGLSCIAGAGLNREVIDEFTNTEEWQVTGGEYSVLVNSGGSSITGCIVEFFEDGPSTVNYATATATISQVLTGNIYFGRRCSNITCWYLVGLFPNPTHGELFLAVRSYRRKPSILFTPRYRI